MIIGTTESLFLQSILYKRKGHGSKRLSIRQKTDDSSPHELIPISFSLKDKVSDYFY